MKTGIMQAYFFPYIGYFQLIDAVDEFIVYEHVTFRKKSWITKNRILDKGRNLAIDIKVPVRKQSSNKLISEIEIDGNNWKKPLLKLIYFNYKKAAYFNEIYALVKKCIEIPATSLHLYNSAILKEICSYLDIKSKIKPTNKEFLNLERVLLHTAKSKEEVKSLRIIEICKHQNSSTYINPAGGTNLYDPTYFQNHEIALFFINTKMYSYQQFNHKFTPHLSIIDVLMHNGKEETKKIIKNYSLI